MRTEAGIREKPFEMAEIVKKFLVGDGSMPVSTLELTVYGTNTFNENFRLAFNELSTVHRTPRAPVCAFCVTVRAG